MLKLRPNTIKEIQSILDKSYFTKDSFFVENDPIRSSFLIIRFLPINEYSFSVKTLKKNYVTSERPGIYLETEEAYEREDFNLIIHAIYAWVDRIKEDLDSVDCKDNEIDLFLNKLRQSFLSYNNETTYFSSDEIKQLNRKLRLLETLVLGKVDSFNISKDQIISFNETLDSIREDLNKYTKNVWYTISGNKIIKEVKSVIKYVDLHGRNELQNKLVELLH